MKQLVRVICPSCHGRAGWIERTAEPALMQESSRITIDTGVLVFVQEHIQVWSPVPELSPRRRRLTTRVTLGFEVDRLEKVAGFRVIDCRCCAPLQLKHWDVAEAIVKAYRKGRTVTFVPNVVAATES